MKFNHALKVLGSHVHRLMTPSQFIWNMCLVAQSTNCFKNMAPLKNLLFKIIPGRLFLGLHTYMEETQCTGNWV